jgi:EamA-like transporter family.
MLAGLIWGMPYFFTELALDSFSTPSIIWLRVTIGALVLIPLVIKSGALKKALKYWPWVLTFGAIEMVGPWFLIPEAHRSVNYGLAYLIITSGPFLWDFDCSTTTTQNGSQTKLPTLAGFWAE